jgi:hypothetical protein
LLSVGWQAAAATERRLVERASARIVSAQCHVMHARMPRLDSLSWHAAQPRFNRHSDTHQQPKMHLIIYRHSLRARQVDRHTPSQRGRPNQHEHGESGKPSCPRLSSRHSLLVLDALLLCDCPLRRRGGCQRHQQCYSTSNAHGCRHDATGPTRACRHCAPLKATAWDSVWKGEVGDGQQIVLNCRSQIMPRYRGWTGAWARQRMQRQVMHACMHACVVKRCGGAGTAAQGEKSVGLTCFPPRRHALGGAQE